MNNTQKSTLRFFRTEVGYLAIYANDTTWADDGPVTVFELSISDEDLGRLAIHFEGGRPTSIELEAFEN